MMGKDFDDLAAIKHSGEEERNFDGADVVIKAAGVGKKGYIKPFDLVIRKGEVIGLTGGKKAEVNYYREFTSD